MANPIVSQEEWLAARRKLLAREKEATKLYDAVRAERQALPWVKVEKNYVFDTPQGRKSLAELFAGRSQLMIYHFMLGPGWGAGCPGCSFLCDHIDGALTHLEHHDVSWCAVSRAPLNEIAAYKKRMGWQFPWVSSFGGDFNRDFHVSFGKEELARGKVVYNFAEIDAAEANDELPGISAFIKNEKGEIFRTYSCYARGAEPVIAALMILDMAPLGRNEKTDMDFVRRHDEYDAVPEVACCHS